MKKILFILALILSLGASAQTYNPEQKYGFWSNWTVGVNITVNQPIETPSVFAPGFGLDIELSKQLSNHWEWRLLGESPILIRTSNPNLDRYVTARTGIVYVPTVDCGLFVAADLGASLKLMGNDYPYVSGDLAIGYKWDFCQHNRIKVEVGFEMIYPQTTNEFIWGPIVRAGWAYRFGATNVDRQIAEQRALILLEGENSVLEYKELRKRFDDTIVKLTTIDSLYNMQIVIIDYLHDSIIYLNGVIDSLGALVEDIEDYTYAPAVVFNCNSAYISNDQNGYLDYMANMVRNQNDTVQVWGFADSQTGTMDYNQKLSQKRADALKRALVRRGCKGDLIISKGKGWNIPYGDSNSAMSRKAILIMSLDKELD